MSELWFSELWFSDVIGLVIFGGGVCSVILGFGVI